ncbi:MAG: CBS domain-containing protein [Planctomycetota bacterium]
MGCTEIIPKTLGTVYASKLTGFVARTTHLLTKALSPILFVTRALTRLVSHGAEENAFSRGELAALVAMAAQGGAIHKDESRVFQNVLKFEGVKVEDVMTPRTVVATFPKDKTVGDAISDARATPYSRIPVYEGTRDQVVGYVLLREILLAAAHGADRDQPIGAFLREVMFIPETASLAQALRQFLERSEHMAVAVDEFGGVSGLVTLEDVVETILGVEITDESDRVPDLREVAMTLRDKRLERVQKAQEALSGRLEATPTSEPKNAEDAG